MLKRLYFLSLFQTERIDGRADTIVISIRDRHFKARLREGFGDVLSLYFDDYEFDGISDRPVDIFTPAHANALRNWLQRYSEANDEFTVLVHCHAGISRSAAIAWWIYQSYQEHGLVLKTTYPFWYLNRDVLRVLDPNMSAPQKPDEAPTFPPDRSFEVLPFL